MINMFNILSNKLIGFMSLFMHIIKYMITAIKKIVKANIMIINIE